MAMRMESSSLIFFALEQADVWSLGHPNTASLPIGVLRLCGAHPGLHSGRDGPGKWLEQDQAE